MPSQTARFPTPYEPDPIVHELPPIEVEGEAISVRAIVRKMHDGAWRGRLVFGPDTVDDPPMTAEILVGENESEFWRAFNELREYHLKDLYRSVT